MISRIESLNYRCLRYVRQDLLPFHVLVGPNASGKSTFLDVLSFMSDLVFSGPAEALSKRAPDVRDLVWLRRGESFELAVNVHLPPERRERLKQSSYTGARYEVRIGVSREPQESAILSESFWLTTTSDADTERQTQRELFPQPPQPPNTIIHTSGQRAPRGWKRVVNKVPGSGNDYFSSETSGWNNLFRLGPQKSALANLPEDETKFPVATWFKELLSIGVQTLALNSERMRRPSLPGAPKFFLPDGSGLPWAVELLNKKYRSRLRD